MFGIVFSWFLNGTENLKILLRSPKTMQNHLVRTIKRRRALNNCVGSSSQFSVNLNMGSKSFARKSEIDIFACFVTQLNLCIFCDSLRAQFLSVWCLMLDACLLFAALCWMRGRPIHKAGRPSAAYRQGGCHHLLGPNKSRCMSPHCILHIFHSLNPSKLF